MSFNENRELGAKSFLWIISCSLTCWHLPRWHSYIKGVSFCSHSTLSPPSSSHTPCICNPPTLPPSIICIRMFTLFLAIGWISIFELSIFLHLPLGSLFNAAADIHGYFSSPDLVFLNTFCFWLCLQQHQRTLFFLYVCVLLCIGCCLQTESLLLTRLFVSNLRFPSCRL